VGLGGGGCHAKNKFSWYIKEYDFRISLKKFKEINSTFSMGNECCKSVQFILSCYSLTHSLTPPSTVLLEKLTGFAASQEIPGNLSNQRVHYRIHKCPLHFSMLSQLNPVHTPTPHFLKIQLNIILPSTPRSPQWSLSLRFPNQKHVHASSLPHPRYIPRPSHS
jgi:hypothetical protein